VSVHELLKVVVWQTCNAAKDDEEGAGMAWVA
jgi:hypothetical protein